MTFQLERKDGFAHRFIPAGHASLDYTGRNDMSRPDAPVLIWQGSGVRANFTGRLLGLSFASVRDRNFFDVILDGVPRLLRLEPGDGDYFLSEGLPAGNHELVLSKRSESLFGTAAFRGLFLEPDGDCGPKPPPFPWKLEVYGDSITAGACNEDAGADQYDDLATHNHLRSYAALAASVLGAELSCIAVSGSGILWSWNPVLMPDVYDKLYPDKASPRADFSGRPPEWVVVNLGQNDMGFPQSRGMRFPAEFAVRYVRFIRGIRTLYPAARIVCAIGGMSGWRDSVELQSAFKTAVDRLRDSDDRIFTYAFQAFSTTHPRTDVHARMADELVAFLRPKLRH